MEGAVNMPPIGQIGFGRGNPEPAKFIVIPRDAAQSDMEVFVEELKTKFGLGEGKVLLSVTGGAQDFKMSASKLEQVFTRGILCAAKNCTGWIVTGGLDAGVMRFVGDASKKGYTGDLPRIGIATYKKVSHFEELREGETVSYTPRKPNDGVSAALNPNHTHFILVDSPKDAWGEEISVRTALEDYITTALKIPLVLIVVNGGPGTIGTVVEGIKRNFPIIIVQGSGRAADAIANMLKGDFGMWQQLTGKMDARESQALILNNKQLITCYNPDEDAAVDMDMAILRAVLSGSRKNDSFEAKVMLGVEWGRADIIRELFELEDEKGSSQGSNLGILNRAMQLSLELDKPEIFRLLVEKGGNKAAINMESLYALPDVKYLMDRLLPFSHSKILKFGKKSSAEASLTASGDFREKSLMLHQDEFSPDLGKSIPASSKELHTAKKVLMKIHSMYYKLLTDQIVTYTDMLMWAIMVNRHDLAKEIWRNSVLPIHSALICVHLYRTLAVWFEGEDDYTTQADWFEEQAVKILDEMEYDTAKTVLMWKWKDLENKNPQEIAQLAQAKDFMSHHYIQRYLAEILYTDDYGGLAIGCSTLTVLRAIFMPYWSPYKRKDGMNTKFYHVYYLPISKFWTSTLSYIFFLILLAAVVILTGGPEILVIEYVLWAWVLDMIFEEVRQFLSEKDSYFYVISNQMDCVMLVLLIIYVGLRIASVVTTDPLTVIASTDILIVATIWCYIRLLYVFCFSQSLGPLFFAMVNMINDVIKWIFVFSVFMISFQLGVMALTTQAGQEMWLAYPTGSFAGTFFTIIGDFGTAMGIMAGSSLGVLLFAIYAFIAQVVLVNLLIAMMGDTYSAIKENAGKEWKFFLYSLVFDYCQCSAYPPPLGLVIEPVAFVIEKICCTAQERKATEPISSIEEMDEGLDGGPNEADSTETIKEMKKAKERVLEANDGEQVSSNESLAKDINLLKRQRENDRIFFEQQFQGIMAALIKIQQTQTNTNVPQ